MHSFGADPSPIKTGRKLRLRSPMARSRHSLIFIQILFYIPIMLIITLNKKQIFITLEFRL